ncbi:DUF6387 family protein [Pseudomonas sp. GL-B-19]|uniref:DUF6387 family protein n=1 Tax=Pseudomonas sp. GL-B-19 TaxID=2832393 RepID=UPI001CBDF505|nr:DUF6387 family protein [Pseudomonas sp. GL-B-19]
MNKPKKWSVLNDIKGLEPYHYDTCFPPKWFDLDNYKNIVSKSSKDWYEAIMTRNFVNIKLKNIVMDDESRVALFIMSFSQAQETLARLNKSKEESEQLETAIINMDAFDYAEILGTYAYNAPDISIDEIIHADNLMPRRPPSDASDSVRSQYKKITYIPVWDMPSESERNYFSRHNKLAPVLIDVTAPDEVIAKSAVDFARSIRERFDLSNLKQKITTKDFEKWSEQRLLAYIDLELWFGAIGEKPAAHKIADLLFPDKIDVDISEYVRKTVRKNARILMGAETYDALTAQSGANI